jgi:hypothetical protein
MSFDRSSQEGKDKEHTRTVNTANIKLKRQIVPLPKNQETAAGIELKLIYSDHNQ